MRQLGECLLEMWTQCPDVMPHFGTCGMFRTKGWQVAGCTYRGLELFFSFFCDRLALCTYFVWMVILFFAKYL